MSGKALFRKSMLGFHKKDVMNYIDATILNIKEEAKNAIIRADYLQGQLDEIAVYVEELENKITDKPDASEKKIYPMTRLNDVFKNVEAFEKANATRQMAELPLELSDSETKICEKQIEEKNSEEVLEKKLRDEMNTAADSKLSDAYLNELDIKLSKMQRANENLKTEIETLRQPKMSEHRENKNEAEAMQIILAAQAAAETIIKDAKVQAQKTEEILESRMVLFKKEKGYFQKKLERASKKTKRSAELMKELSKTMNELSEMVDEIVPE